MNVLKNEEEQLYSCYISTYHNTHSCLYQVICSKLWSQNAQIFFSLQQKLVFWEL